MAAQARSSSPKHRVDPSLRGWVLVVLGGHDAVLGRLVLEEDTLEHALAAEISLREELLAGRVARAGLRPAYALGSVAVPLGGPSAQEAVVEWAASTLDPLGQSLGVGEGGAITHVALTCFQFCADWREPVRARVARRLEETVRYAEDAARELV